MKTTSPHSYTVDTWGHRVRKLQKRAPDSSSAEDNIIECNVYTLQMTPEEWSKVQPNPRQRDTEARAKKARHLMNPEPIHAKVNMAILPDGTRIKLDGHTRGYLWDNDIVQAPKMLSVDVWPCSSLDEAMRLYTMFDNPGAVETAPDRIAGAHRQHELTFNSPVLRNRQYTNALKCAHAMLYGSTKMRNENEYDLVRHWKPELLLLDACHPTKERFPGGILAGALVTFRRHGPRVSGFWQAYASDSGEKSRNSMDAVEALERKRSAEKSSGRYGGRSNDLLAIYVISAVEGWLRNQKYQQGLRRMEGASLASWAARTRNTARTW